MKKGIAIIGATGGLGEAVALTLAKRVPVTIGYGSNHEKATALAEKIKRAGGMAETAQIDMRNGASVKAFLDGVASKWDGLEAIVSMTGPNVPLCPLVEVSEEDFKRIYETDVFGSFNILKHGSTLLKAGGGGAIVLCLTTAVLRTLELDGMSGGPKTAVAALIKQVAREMGPANVRINGIAPASHEAAVEAITAHSRDGRATLHVRKDGTTRIVLMDLNAN